ncbi:Uma2 family endonuclease [Chamaesiphon sp. VAR_69_metabat_338]|uniref:Uma2 family endonuclease n=1 Tax=Chamaesiphon sp. VAR_69_metabat_338 TaxID=2964704 RepID=UPI00286DC076|nr:Uma2 family endonuclease [Chamaesiphon sp. VAR_69_metabat_338]
MVASVDRLFMSPTEYLAWEEEQPFKHEYLNGEVYAMTGGTLGHNQVAINLVAMLRTFFRGKGCRVFINDVKVQVSAKGPYFYPDLVVTCNSDDFRRSIGDPKAPLKLISYPQLIIEVLSPGTEGYDRGEKFKQYRQMPSLQEYIIIDPRQIAIECYRLNDRQKWELTPYFSEDIADPTMVEFPCIEFECSIAAIYEDVEFDTPA